MVFALFSTIIWIFYQMDQLDVYDLETLCESWNPARFLFELTAMLSCGFICLWFFVDRFVDYLASCAALDKATPIPGVMDAKTCSTSSVAHHRRGKLLCSLVFDFYCFILKTEGLSLHRIAAPSRVAHYPNTLPILGKQRREALSSIFN